MTVHRFECPLKLLNVDISVWDVGIQWFIKIGINMKKRKWRNICTS